MVGALRNATSAVKLNFFNGKKNMLSVHYERLDSRCDCCGTFRCS